jgi:hypothetical protein
MYIKIIRDMKKVAVGQVAKGQIVEFSIMYPTRDVRAKVVKTRKNAVTVEVVDINNGDMYFLPAEAHVTIVNI